MSGNNQERNTVQKAGREGILLDEMESSLDREDLLELLEQEEDAARTTETMKSYNKLKPLYF